jgi:hypothetical protein
MESGLFLKTTAILAAMRSAHLPVVGTDFRHRPIAPAMPNFVELLAGSGKNLVRLGRDIHLFRPKIFAEIWVHGSWK